VLEESIFIHLRNVKAVLQQLRIPSRFMASLFGLTLCGVASEYYASIYLESLSWYSLERKLREHFASAYHVEAADATLRELTLRRLVRPGDTIMEGMERLLHKVKHLTSIVHLGRERESDIRRALLYAVGNEWFAAKLPSHMNSTSDVMLQVSRVAKARRYTFTPVPVVQKVHYRALEGRQYRTGPANAQETKKMNPKDSQGRVMLCRACGSPEHFVLQCPAKSEVVNALFEQLLSPPESGADRAEEDEPDFVPDSEEADYVSQMSQAEAVNLANDMAESADLIAAGMESQFANEDDSAFRGICLDTGTTRSMIGTGQFEALSRRLRFRPRLHPADRMFRCGNELIRSSGVFDFRLPLGPSHFVTVKVDVVRVANPFLLGLNDMKRMRMSIDTQTMTCRVLGIVLAIEERDKHLWLPLPATESCCFTVHELRTLHNRTGHPSTDRLLTLLKKAAPEELDATTRATIDEIVKRCSLCLQTRPKPYVFRVSVPDEAVFGHELLIDLAKIDGKYVLHCVDRGTGLNAARFLNGESAREVWDALLEVWITKYVTPDVITTDAGSAFVSALFYEHAKTFGILLKQVPVESHSSLSSGEQAHGPLRRIYEKLPTSVPRDVRLSLAVKAVNELPNTAGFIPLHLVYGVIPKMPIFGIKTPYVKQRERMEALRLAREAYSVWVAEKRLRLAQDVRGPGAHEIKEGDLCYVFREESKRWEGPGRVVSIDAGNVVHVHKGGKVSPFNVASVRRYISQDDPDERAHLRTEVASSGDDRFTEAKRAELKQLEDRRTFEWVDRSMLPPGTNILRTRWVLVKKNPPNSAPIYKARLVVLGHLDPEKDKVVSESPTVRAVSIRLLCALAVGKRWTLFTRDVTGAFLQSADIKRTIYVELPRDARRDGDRRVMRLLKPQYGLSEAPTYWWLTYSDHHVRQMNCESSLIDPCLFLHLNGEGCTGALGTLVDDVCGAGDEEFLKKEERESKRFIVKPRKLCAFDFGGCLIEQSHDTVTMSQKPYTDELQELPREASFEEFRSARGKLQWALYTRVDLAVNVARMAQVTETSYQHADVLYHNRTVRDALQNKCHVVMTRVDLQSATLVVYCDASFATNRDCTSQLAFVIFLRSDDGNCALLDAASKKCPRVTRSVMGAELLAISFGFDRAYILQATLKTVLRRTVPILVLTGSMQIFHAVTRLSQMSEKRLLIDVSVLVTTPRADGAPSWQWSRKEWEVRLYRRGWGV
jgi:hypothetical protein